MQPRLPVSPQQIFIFLVFLFIFAPRLFGILVFFGGLAYVGFLIYTLVKGRVSTFRENFNSDNTSEISPNVFAAMNEFKLKPKHIVSIMGLVVLAVIIIDGFVSVPAGHVAVIYDRGRGVLEETYPEGLHLKIPFWQVAYLMDIRLQTYTMSIAAGEGAVYGDDSIESLTRDGQKVDIDVSILYRLDKEKVAAVYQDIGLDYVGKVIRPIARNEIRDIITGYDSTELFNQTTREAAQDKMIAIIGGKTSAKNITLDDVLLRNIRFSDVYLQAIEAKQVAQQRIQKAEYEKLEAEKVKERKIIEAQAEAEAIRLKGETLRANPSVIQFEFVQKMAPQINWGIMPDNAIPLLDLKQLTN